MDFPNIAINPDSEVPIYVQVKNQIRLLIETKQVAQGTQLPTVRDLAIHLQINANTVSRIYADLEREGYIARRRGIGTFAVDPREGEKSEIPGKASLVETIRQLRALGYSSRQILELTAEALRDLEG